jgi:hypothetical protein
MVMMYLHSLTIRFGSSWILLMNELKKLPLHFIYTWRKFIFASMFVLGVKLVLQNPSSFGRLHHKFQYMFWYNPYSTVSITLYKRTHWWWAVQCEANNVEKNRIFRVHIYNGINVRTSECQNVTLYSDIPTFRRSLWLKLKPKITVLFQTSTHI